MAKGGLLEAGEAHAAVYQATVRRAGIPAGEDEVRAWLGEDAQHLRDI